MTTLVLAGNLIAKPGEEPLARHTIRIENERIVGVEAGFSAAKSGETLIDLSDRTVLPGLIDCHVHLTAQFGPEYRMQAVEQSAAAVALHAARNARATLDAGFTTVRDLGEMAGSGDAIFALRNAIAKRCVPGPRIFAAGAIISPTGGHGTACGYRDDINLLFDSSGRADGADGCRAAVRRQVLRGADFIKLVATGGVLTNTETGTDQQFFDDEYKAIINTAKILGRKTTAHAHGADGMKAALRAGVDAIEHGTFMDDEVIEMMLVRGVVYVPTLLAGITVAEQARNAAFLPDAIRRKALETGPHGLTTFARGHGAGLAIAFGTDSGVSKHGDNAREFALMVKAGMTPMQAITAATLNAAANIGQSNHLGSIEAGKFADLIAVDHDPLADINVLMQVSFVMKAGVVHRQTLG